MEMPASEPRPASDQHDAALALALGLLAATQSFEASVARLAAPGSRPLAVDDPIVVAALGAISLGHSLRRWLEEAAEPQMGPHVDPTTTPLPTHRELLR